MFIANDFINRLSADPGALPPHVKSEVCDENFKKIIATSGAHQRLLDVSHCTSLTTKGFGVIRACTTLQFLDVSYTNIRDLNFLQVTCSVLKGLNIAGLNLKYYDFIGKLDSLEILILRESTFKKGDTLKDLLLLRSLDIAYTEVDDLTPLYNFERLEELYLDGCPSLCKIIHDDVIDVLGRWPNLRMLNMSDCGFIPDWEPETVMQIPNTELFIDSFSHM
jgi:Leucine-rich repeat (LRR) protein